MRTRYHCCPFVRTVSAKCKKKSIANLSLQLIAIKFLICYTYSSLARQRKEAGQIPCSVLGRAKEARTIYGEETISHLLQLKRAQLDIFFAGSFKASEDQDQRGKKERKKEKNVVMKETKLGSILFFVFSFQYLN